MKLFDALLLVKKLNGELMDLRKQRISAAIQAKDISDINSSIFSLMHKIAKIDGKIRKKNSEILSTIGTFSTTLILVALLREEIKSLEAIEDSTANKETSAGVDAIKSYIKSLRHALKKLLFEIKEVNMNNEIDI